MREDKDRELMVQHTDKKYKTLCEMQSKRLREQKETIKELRRKIREIQEKRIKLKKIVKQQRDWIEQLQGDRK